MTVPTKQKLPPFEEFQKSVKQGIVDDPSYLPLDAYGPAQEDDASDAPAKTNGRAQATRAKSPATGARARRPR
jgi:hypothetical protein